jgi:hypothetical protein
MAIRKFGRNDIIYNTLRANPKADFFVYDGNTYYNATPQQSGAFHSNILDIKSGLSLYEYNIDRTPDAYVTVNPNAHVSRGDNPIIYPYLSKDSARASIASAGGLSQASFNGGFQFGDILTGSYPQSGSITREYLPRPSASYNIHYYSLKNSLNFYGVRSEHYVVSSSLGNKDIQPINLIHIPSIFYGTKIKPGTMSLKWYFTGSLIGELKDSKENGELIQVGPTGSTGSGSVAGVVLYDEGFVLLTGSWDLNSESIGLSSSGGVQSPQWLYFAAGAESTEMTNPSGGPSAKLTQDNAGATFVSASFDMSFRGITRTQVLTMYAHAGRGEVNYSNNPTFLKYGQEPLETTSSHVYQQNSNRLMMNIVSSSYGDSDYSASFKRQVYISKIGVYDMNKNLIGVATLASPVRKEEAETVSFKIKLDI